MSIYEDIVQYIKSGETSNKKLGLEIEHFVVNEEGVQITFEQIVPLIEEVAKGIGAKPLYTDGYVVGYVSEEYVITLEPACQFEISINPYERIEDIKRVYEEFRQLWDKEFEQIGYHIEVGGVLPAVENGKILPIDIPLSKKNRYKYMDEYFKKSGKYGEYMMRASGSTQISVDYKSEDDLRRKLEVLQIISPIISIMFENKSNPDYVLPESDGKKHLIRIQEWEALDKDRTGFLDHSRVDFGYRKIAEDVVHTPLILLTENGETSYVGNKNALDLINEKIIDYDNASDDEKKRYIEHFISMGFYHFRIKKYIEIRVADAVPIDVAVAFAALIKGIVYNVANVDKVLDKYKSITTIDDINEAIQSVEKDGFNAEIYDGRKAIEHAEELLSIASDGLDNEEKEYLKYVRDFWN